MTDRKTGVVKWFSVAKEYGFITSPEYPDDVFFHRRDCGVSVPAKGAAVEWDLHSHERGIRASNVRAVK
jgi:cold shock CspA family protein